MTLEMKQDSSLKQAWCFHILWIKKVVKRNEKEYPISGKSLKRRVMPHYTHGENTLPPLCEKMTLFWKGLGTFHVVFHAEWRSTIKINQNHLIIQEQTHSGVVLKENSLNFQKMRSPQGIYDNKYTGKYNLVKHRSGPPDYVVDSEPL